MIVQHAAVENIDWPERARSLGRRAVFDVGRAADGAVVDQQAVLQVQCHALGVAVRIQRSARVDVIWLPPPLTRSLTLLFSRPPLLIVMTPSLYHSETLTVAELLTAIAPLLAFEPPCQVKLALRCC